jgi:hypothetical protein
MLNPATVVGALITKQTSVSAVRAVVHPVKVESVYRAADESAGISAAVIDEAEAVPVHEECATVWTSMVAEPETFPIISTL